MTYKSEYHNLFGKETTLVLAQPHIEFIDDLVVRLKRQQRQAYRLFYALFGSDGENESRLIDIICNLLESPMGNIKWFNLAIKLANLVLIKFNRDCTSNREWLPRLCEKLVERCAQECVESMKLKCLNCLYNVLERRHGCEIFMSTCFSKFIGLFPNSVKLSSRVSIAVASILAKVSYFTLYEDF